MAKGQEDLGITLSGKLDKGPNKDDRGIVSARVTEGHEDLSWPVRHEGRRTGTAPVEEPPQAVDRGAPRQMDRAGDDPVADQPFPGRSTGDEVPQGGSVNEPPGPARPRLVRGPPARRRAPGQLGGSRLRWPPPRPPACPGPRGTPQHPRRPGRPPPPPAPALDGGRGPVPPTPAGRPRTACPPTMRPARCIAPRLPSWRRDLARSSFLLPTPRRPSSSRRDVDRPRRRHGAIPLSMATRNAGDRGQARTPPGQAAGSLAAHLLRRPRGRRRVDRLYPTRLPGPLAAHAPDLACHPSAPRDVLR